ncbi:hypothetical protein GOODEAATRI_015867 [Goodea atripinnis]|uniref:Immunoglobulin-like beta-sandwich domain-containing protein n=1 Tax=Goodea atripinnis TaxID=208336 RepID=A0ABV0MI49_9TELE
MVAPRTEGPPEPGEKNGFPIGRATGASSRSTLAKAAKIIACSGHGSSPGPELTELQRELPEPSFPPILGGSPSRSRGSEKGSRWSSRDWNSELEGLTEIPSSSRSSPDSQAAAAWKAGVGSGALSRALSCSTSTSKSPLPAEMGAPAEASSSVGCGILPLAHPPASQNTVEADDPRPGIWGTDHVRPLPVEGPHTKRTPASRSQTWEMQISRGNASLLLRGVKVQDKGTYKCYTSTVHGNKQTLVNLKVDAAVSNVSISLVENRIICSSEGIYPQPELTWSTIPPSNTIMQNRTRVQQTEEQLYSISSSEVLNESRLICLLHCVFVPSDCSCQRFQQCCNHPLLCFKLFPPQLHPHLEVQPQSGHRPPGGDQLHVHSFREVEQTCEGCFSFWQPDVTGFILQSGGSLYL